jgi:hydrophobic/amphiphilic exporter-1 (mainly G- bacteria), HAE1 family
MPEVIVATFYNGMPPIDIETTLPIRWSVFSRWPPAWTTSESRSLLGVSMIKVYFSREPAPTPM